MLVLFIHSCIENVQGQNGKNRIRRKRVTRVEQERKEREWVGLIGSMTPCPSLDYIIRMPKFSSLVSITLVSFVPSGAVAVKLIVGLLR